MGIVRTIIFTFEAAAGHGLIPVVVNVKTAVPENAAGGVHVAFKSLALGENTPPEVVDQVPPVAEPPTAPLKFTELPWQIVCADPAFAVGVGEIMIFILDDTD